MRSAAVPADPFAIVRRVGLTLPGVEVATKYDGSPLLKVGGRFMAGLATHPSAEPATLVVRSLDDERELLLEDAPEIYYLTDHYRRFPIVLARLSHLDEVALRDLLIMSRRLTVSRYSSAAKPRSRRPR